MTDQPSGAGATSGREGERPEEGTLDRALAEGWTLERLEREYLLAVFRRTGENRTRTAEILGVDRRTVYRKLKQYEEAGLLDGRGHASGA